MGAGGSIWALVPAAGAGKRLGADKPKQYLPLLGQPVIVHTLKRLATHPDVAGVMVGLAADDPHWAAAESLLTALPVPIYTFVGGAERADTVLNGLRRLGAEAARDSRVLVHDAARPCIRHQDIDRLIAGVGNSLDGGILALPLADTVKRVNTDGAIQETVDRSVLWRALTPQYFRIDSLTHALEHALGAKKIVTDEAAAMELSGYHPRVVEGSSDNIKITYMADLALAELYMQRQHDEARV